MLFKKIFLIATGTILLAACTKETAEEPQRKFMSFKLDGQVILSEQDHRAYYMPGILDDANPDNDESQMFMIGASYTQDAITLSITNENGAITPGVYHSSVPGNSMSFTLNPSQEELVANNIFGDLTVTILSMSSDSVLIGQFSGTLVSQDNGNIKTVKDGYFKVKYLKY